MNERGAATRRRHEIAGEPYGPKEMNRRTGTSGTEPLSPARIGDTVTPDPQKGHDP